MLSKENSLPAPTGKLVHCLKGKALRHWWQIGRDKPANKFINKAIKAHLAFLSCLPIFAIFCYIKVGPQATKLILLSVIVWFADFMMLLAAVRHHLHRILQVQQCEDGVLMKSLFFERKIQWLQIRDFVPLQNHDYLLDSTSGDQFILSDELTDSIALFENIKNKIPKTQLSYDYSYRVGDELFDSAYMASFALVVAVMFPLLRSLLYGLPIALHDLAGLLLFLVIPFFLWWIHSSKIVQLIRFSPSSLLIRTRSDSRILDLERVTNIKKIGGFFIIKSREYWCVIMAGSNKKDPLVARLLECRSALPMLNRTHL